jgi:hypothetical protein
MEDTPVSNFCTGATEGATHGTRDQRRHVTCMASVGVGGVIF